MDPSPVKDSKTTLPKLKKYSNIDLETMQATSSAVNKDWEQIVSNMKCKNHFQVKCFTLEIHVAQHNTDEPVPTISIQQEALKSTV